MVIMDSAIETQWVTRWEALARQVHNLALTKDSSAEKGFSDEEGGACWESHLGCREGELRLVE
jgi:hypothetical protein